MTARAASVTSATATQIRSKQAPQPPPHAMTLIPIRAVRAVAAKLGPTTLRYTRRTPNYEQLLDERQRGGELNR